METSPATLAERVGTLRASVQADSASGWLPPSLHALIMSCLARIFGRLEQMLLLWQSDARPLPQSAARRTFHPRATSPHQAPRRLRTRNARRDSATPGIPPRAPAIPHRTAAACFPTPTAPSRARAVRLPPPH